MSFGDVRISECDVQSLSVVRLDTVGPSRAQVELAPAVLRTGSTANLTCFVDEANPAPRVSWSKTSHDGRLETGLVSGRVREWRTAATHGGNVVVSQMKMIVSADDDLTTVACMANGTKTAVNQVQLRVLCKQSFL